MCQKQHVPVWNASVCGWQTRICAQAHGLYDECCQNCRRIKQGMRAQASHGDSHIIHSATSYPHLLNPNTDTHTYPPLPRCGMAGHMCGRREVATLPERTDAQALAAPIAIACPASTPLEHSTPSIAHLCYLSHPREANYPHTPPQAGSCIACKQAWLVRAREARVMQALPPHRTRQDAQGLQTPEV